MKPWERIVDAVVPHCPIHCSGSTVLKSALTVGRKYGGAPSCLRHKCGGAPLCSSHKCGGVPLYLSNKCGGAPLCLNHIRTIVCKSTSYNNKYRMDVT